MRQHPRLHRGMFVHSFCTILLLLLLVVSSMKLHLYKWMMAIRLCIGVALTIFAAPFTLFDNIIYCMNMNHSNQAYCQCVRPSRLHCTDEDHQTNNNRIDGSIAQTTTTILINVRRWRDEECWCRPFNLIKILYFVLMWLAVRRQLSPSP